MTKIALVACSNPLKDKDRKDIESLVIILNQLGLTTVFSPLLFKTSLDVRSLAIEKATEFMKYNRDPSVDAIFDVSGGDAAVCLLPFLDWSELCRVSKPYFGYSDNSVILNTLVAKTHCSACYFFLKNIIYADDPASFFRQTTEENRNRIMFPYSFLRGDFLQGTIVGGNIRCFSKLAGTEYFPDLTDKILFLESLGGDVNRIASYYMQLSLQPGFHKIRGIVFGTFTQVKSELSEQAYNSFLKTLVGKTFLPVVRTDSVGHDRMSCLLPLGVPVTFALC